MNILRRTDYLLISLGVLLVYGLGLFLPILNSDPAFNATVALRMYQSGDYISLINQFEPYLDKPHLSFWLAAASFELFGVSAWTYRLPSLLVSVLGIYATYRLGKEAYNKETGALAAVVLATMQAQVLANHDVRMDALLTGFVAVGAWQLYEYLRYGSTRSVLWGGAMAGLAFDVKGMVGVGVLGIAFLVEVLHQRSWRRLFSVKIALAFVAFVVVISPVLWAYYMQFDLHPELVIAGRKGLSGVRFILWDQNFERMSGGRFGQNGANDPLFFFHTLLWAVLPWSLLVYAAWITRFIYIRRRPVKEWLTGGGALACMVVFSFSSFKLPHYLNILFPLMAVWVAGWIVEAKLMQTQARLRFLIWVQSVVPVLMIGVALLLSFWIFSRGTGTLAGTLLVVFGAGLALYLYFIRDALRRVLLFSALGALYVNSILNGLIYPELDTYQAGNQLAKVIRQQGIPTEKLFFAESTPLFYDLELGIEQIIPYATPEQVNERLQNRQALWLIIDPTQVPGYLRPGVRVVNQRCFHDFHITRLTGTFLNPDTRPQTLDTYCLVELVKE
ncbi:glycosyltransferase family 39 protein [Telluribacter sp.]|jgi:4-amino-4-deoxy-L-arabinose transferase-like glycosyltransferase|uniref:ArnT family glycosyltransferase n=1 Tax=Telluribacter sp. TaxID=1978767 RepID=UPI002E151F24|nr:glycosyltransferase family 39 protein [Telluribacter sp.]